MFGSAKKVEALPATSDALHYHLKRSHLQTAVWEYEGMVDMNLSKPQEGK